MNDNVYSAQEAAEKVGCDVRTIHRLAQRHQVGMSAGRVFVFRESDILFLRLRKQPQGFQEGNALWRKRKRP